ncbi:MAG: ATP-dependent DNA helicase, partial [Candidatus Paceibacterota bacterium]
NKPKKVKKTKEESDGEVLSKTESEKQKKRDDKNLELAFVYEHYELVMAQVKAYDFDDMLLELIRAMENNQNFKLILQENYHYILADEHQDANASQNKILELLADFHDSPNLFIVGDDKQAIYRFQGASLENFLYFSRKYKEARVIDLEHNYRSHQGILDASHSLISKNPTIPGRDRTKLLSLQIGSKPIFVDEFATVEEELTYLAMILERLLKKGEKAEEIAILYRENKQAAVIAEALRGLGLPFRIESDHNLLEEPDVTKIVLLCQAIHDPSSNEYLSQALLLPEMKCDPAALSELFNLANREAQPLHTLLESLSNKSKGKQALPLIKGKSLKDIVGLERLEEISNAYKQILAWSSQAQVLSFPQFLQALIQETGLAATLVAAPDSLERLACLEAFFDQVVKAANSRKTFYLRDFIDYIKIVSSHGLSAKRGYTDHVSGIRLMTAHRAKGLEFNHVFIVRANDGLWGNRSHRNLFNIPIIEHARDAGRIEDERRLFYVAMTRARESVNISYARSDGEKELLPSQFMTEIDPALISFGRPFVAERLEIFKKKMVSPSPGRTLSILDVSFVKSKFLAQPFSVTHLNNYLECPWRYFFVNLIRLPQAPTKHQMYGTAIHATLRTFFEAYKVEADLSLKKFLEIFKFNLDRQPLSVLDRRESLAKGKAALEGYYEEYNSSWGRHLLTEYAVKGVEMKSFPGLQLTGKIDKIEFMDERNVIVTDFKTAKPKSRNEIEGKTKTADGNYLRQLVFYRMLLDDQDAFQMKYGEIDFIEPNERGIYKKERFEIGVTEVEALKEVIKKTAEEITTLAFLDSTCSDKECSFCKLGKILQLSSVKNEAINVKD